jgi:hypothetical protein
MSYKIQSVAVALVGAALLGFMAGYWVVIRDPIGTGASIVAFPAILTVAMLTVLFLTAAFILWATSHRAAPYVFLLSILLPIFFLISPELIRTWL